MESLRNKVVLITGASSGIGAAIAEYFARFGCNLVLTGRNQENLQTTKQKCLSAGLQENQIHVHPADMRVEDQISQLVHTTVQTFQKLDVLVNNAGIEFFGPSTIKPIDEYDETMNVNVRAVVLVTQYCIPHLIQSKGSIVNVSSIDGIRPHPFFTYYCMSKAALDQFTKCLALELAPNGIRVNSVNPGVTKTNILKRAGMPEEKYQEFLAKCQAVTPLKRVAELDEIAKAVAFLASDVSSFTTGHLMVVDGGLSISAAVEL